MITGSRRLKWKYWYPISVDIERALGKLRRKTDALYNKIWPFVFASYVLIILGAAIVPISKDTLNYFAGIKMDRRVNSLLDEPFSDRFQHWRTDGNPGQDPPLN
jgi:hypothetical protein